MAATTTTAAPATATWQLQEAKNKLSEVVRRAKKEPQTITLHGAPAVVVVSAEDYRALQEPKESLLDVMARCPADLSEIIPPRDRDATMRPVFS